MRLLGWLRRNLMIVGPYLLVVLVAAGGSFLAVRKFEDQASAQCADRRDGRQVLREVVIKATEPGQRVDLTRVPGFDGLDPATQAYITNLSNATNAQPSSSSGEEPLRDRLLDLIPPIDC